ncbi:formylglycine-generating enzyme family protein, partial [Candidatus Marithioploca araucensis]|nr:formylglycine-generating enzyme family protein [Candidatus Marithioploca araucensis]
MFETTQEFQTRRQHLLKQFNQQVQGGDTNYQAGTASLTHYNADQQIFLLKLDWQAKWVKQLGILPQQGTLKIARDYAKKLYKTGRQKRLFVTAQLVNNRFETKGMLREQGRNWTIELLSIPIPEMVTIPAGRFQMGSNRSGDEKPVHGVSIKTFAMSRYEITFDEYDAFAEATGREKPSDQGWGRGHRPVINVSWHDAVAYTKWLTEQMGQEYRLPTEAEWEYAARAGTETDYWWGNEIGSNRANCHGSGSQWSGKSTSPVGSFKANPFGLFDTAGNVWEWCADNWHKNYKGAPTDGTVWKGGDESYRVLRGGSWGSLPVYCRSAFRSRSTSDDRVQFVGFR